MQGMSGKIRVCKCWFLSQCRRALSKRARAFIFSVESESEDAVFDLPSVSDSDKDRAVDAKLADALLKIVQGKLARRLAVVSEKLAKRCFQLAGRQILFLIYREFGKDALLTDVQS